MVLKANPMRISNAGSCALLLDMSNGPFEDEIQSRIWAYAKRVSDLSSVTMALPGANNLLVVHDPDLEDPDALCLTLRQEWESVDGDAPAPREHIIPVTYDGEDLDFIASKAKMSVENIAALHQSGTYRVAMLGYSPGFGYLTGLHSSLNLMRRDTPRLNVARHSVCIGGGFTCIIPSTAPSGWHIIGTAHCAPFFDPNAPSPCLLKAGDIVRFERV